MSDERINTGGGAGIQGDANTGGGNLTGRDAPSNVINFTAPETFAQNIFYTLLRIEGKQDGQGERLAELERKLDFQGERLRGVENDLSMLKHGAEARQRQTDSLEQKFTNFELNIGGRIATLENEIAKLARREPGTVHLTRGQWIGFTVFVFVVAAFVALGLFQFYFGV